MLQRKFDDKDDLIDSKKPLVVFLVMLLIILIIGIVYYYESKRDLGKIPIIYADETPFKVKPEDPGGMVIPNMDKTIYDNFNENINHSLKVAKLLPAPEKPFQLKSKINDSTDSGSKQIESLQKSLPKSSPEVITGLLQNQKNSKKVILTDEIKEAKNPYILHKKAKSGVKILLGSYQSEELTEQSWIALRKKYTKQLVNLAPIIKVREIDGKGRVYQLQAGYFSSKNEARAFCKYISSRGQSCFLVQ